MRVPPTAGPRVVSWRAMTARSPAAASWTRITSSWPISRAISRAVMGAREYTLPFLSPGGTPWWKASARACHGAIEDIRGVLALLRLPAQPSDHEGPALRGHDDGPRRPGHRGGAALSAVGAGGARAGLRSGLDRPLLLREEPAGDLHVPLLVAARGLPDVSADADGEDGGGAGAGDAAL